jgi:hypothetical protein
MRLFSEALPSQQTKKVILLNESLNMWRICANLQVGASLSSFLSSNFDELPNTYLIQDLMTEKEIKPKSTNTPDVLEPSTLQVLEHFHSSKFCLQ